MRTRMKRLASLFLALVMVFTLIPPVALAAGVNESLVSSLAAIYDGDEVRAREELEALYEAGIIDEDGNLVALNIREDGVSVELDEVARRIADGGTVGALTVNGNAATAEQIVQIQSVKGLLEMIRLMDEDVEITDEHVANLQALLEGIADGSIDLNSTIESGGMLLSANRSLRLLASGSVSDLPNTSTGSGSVEATDGKYTAPYISGSTYNAEYQFELSDPTNTTWYTESKVQDGVVTLSCDQTQVQPGDTVTVTATLDKAQSVPVSFDYSAVSGDVGASGSGTVTWAKGESGDKTFTVTAADKESGDLWNGSRAFVINAGNIKNATFSGGNTAWSKAVTVTASDGSDIQATYPPYNINITGFSSSNKTMSLSDDIDDFSVNIYYQKLTNVISLSSDFTATLNLNSNGAKTYFRCGIFLVEPTMKSFNTDCLKVYSYKGYNSIGKEVTRKEVDFDATKAGAQYKRLYNNYNFMPVAMPSAATLSGDVTGLDVGDNNEIWMVVVVAASKATTPTLNSVDVLTRAPAVTNTVNRVTVPEGTYYSGQTVPITVELENFAVVNADTKLKVNDVDCTPLDAVNTETKKVTFSYTVKSVDTGSLNITTLSGLKNSAGLAETLSSAFTGQSFGTTQGVTLVSDVKRNSLDLTNVKYGIDDGDSGEQVVTVLVPFKSGADKTWVTNEAVKINADGSAIDLPVPGYSDGKATHYLAGAYLSYDGGTTRYPVYLVNSGSTEGVALAARFVPPMNETAYLRKDTVELFMDTDILTSDDATKYLPAYSEMEKDAKGFAYADGETEAAPAFVGSNWSYYVKGGVFFETKDAGTEEYQTYIARPDTGDTAAAEDQDGVMEGFLKRADGKYVVLQDLENPGNQYDVEIVVDQNYYDAMTGSMRAESPTDMTLSYQCSERKKFTFVKPKDFEWVCYKVVETEDGITLEEDTTSFEIVLDKSTPEDGKTPGIWHVVPTGVGDGRFCFRLKVKNGAEAKSYTLSMVQDAKGNAAPGQPITVVMGKDPFLTIPAYSQVRTTLTGEPTDILFASNVAARNTYAGQSTTFTATLYAAEADGEGGYKKTGNALKTGSDTSEGMEQINRYTIPKEWLNEAGIYAVELSTTYVGGENQGNMTGVTGSVAQSQELGPATAYLIVKQAPVKVTLNKLASYSVTSDKIPSTLGYTLDSATAGVKVEYTIQKSGEPLGEDARKKIENGTKEGGSIPFLATAPEKLKESYTITVYARNNENNENEPWSVDSMLLTVYNNNILDILVKDVVAGEIGGTTGGKVGDGTMSTTGDEPVAMDNHEKVSTYLNSSEYQLTFEDFTTLRTDMSLQKIISANYGAGVWGLLSDKMQWASSDPATVSVDYKQGGIYSDIRNYSYVSYAPATDFLLVGKGDTAEGKTVKVTATHAATGMSASIDVTAKTLTDQLYVFQFYPKTTTTVTYTTTDEDGKEVKRELTSNDKGELAVYEPYGITGAVMATSTNDGDTYVGTIYPSELVSGERDIASLQLYPCNNLRLRAIANAALNIVKPDGQPYSGDVTVRAGVYKNGVYCPEALVKTEKGAALGQDGKQDISATASNGKLNLWFDPMQFNVKTEEGMENGGLQPGDTVTYVIEYRVASYRPGYVILNAYSDLEGAAKPTDSVVQLRNNVGKASLPQITRMTLQQYAGETPTAYTRDVIDYTEDVGISTHFNKAELTVDVALTDAVVTKDDAGYATCSGDSISSFAIYTAAGKKLSGQTGGDGTEAQQIVELKDLTKDTALYVFPFSSTAMARSVYTMTDANLRRDGITDQGSDAIHSARVTMTFTRGNLTVKNETLPFGVSNLSHQEDLGKAGGASAQLGQQIKEDIKGKVDIGAIFKQITVNEMIRNGFVFLQQMSGAAGDNMLNMMILPTEDPASFRIMVFVGYNERKEENTASSGNLSVNYDPEQVYDDAQKFEKALEDMAKDDDDDDDDSSGEGSLKFNFYGTLLLDARLGIADGDWDISFAGGNVGTNFKAGYEWSQTFMCGPVPVLISFEVGFNADLEVAFCERNQAKAMLLDVAAGVSLEAFAGLGFDLSLVAFKLGIFGKIGADVNFLYLLPENKTGTKLDIDGEIGLKMEAKVLFVSYKKTFASTGFGWTKNWGMYNEIQKAWEKGEPLNITGLTMSGRAYSMRLFANGTALVEIEGGGEIENRDYLELADRVWNTGAPSGRRLLKVASPLTNVQLNDVQTNAYPYANPVLTDDGSMFLYISDNDNADELQSVVSYATWNGTGYTNGGALYDVEGENAILADSDVVASGTSSNAFAAWVKQHESPEKEMHAEATYDDLGMMMNATEVYAGVYNGNVWTTERLTENSVADMAPTVASIGDKAIVAWRSLSATEMPAEGGSDDLTAMFNAENNINYRIYKNGTWTDAQVAYNGAAGTVNAIDSAMLSDGTAILVYTVRTGADVTSTETFYTVIDANGGVLTTGRLTNDSYTDTGVQVAAVNGKTEQDKGQFVVGWYSEHDAGETAYADEETVVAHDIRLARINANGSVDASFPESVGGTGSADIGSDFHFSQPSGNDDLNNLSIVWAQPKNSDAEEDAGKYEINAVRFYQTADETPIIGVSAPTDIAETGKNFTVDHFDTYTDDESGKVYTLILGSDYGTGNLKEEDVIDLSDLDIEAEGVSNDMLRILSVDPVASMKLGSGTFTETAIEATADTDLRELVTGLNLPVQFTVTNTGTARIDKITIGNAVSKEFANLSLLPNETATLVVDYPVPETHVQDITFTVTPDSGTAESVNVVLNRPDVGISGMKLLRESDTTRDIQVTLCNSSGIPLANSGKAVKLAFYKDGNHTQQVGKEISIPASAYADIDGGYYTYLHTLNVSDFIDSEAKEIPDEGIRVYARAWVEGVEELYTTDNDSFLSFKGLLTKYESVMTMDTFLEENNGQYTVNATIRNNSLQSSELGKITADILDDKNHVLKSVELTEIELTLNGEHKESLASQLLTLEGTPASVALRSSTNSVLLDAETNGGVADTTAVALTKDGTLPTILPEAKRAGYMFNGWFTEPSGGEIITKETLFLEKEPELAPEPEERQEEQKETEKEKVSYVLYDEEKGGYVIYAQFTKSSTGGSATKTITAPVTGDTGTVTVTTTVKGTDATIAPLTAEQVDSIVGSNASGNQSSTVAIDVSNLGTEVKAVTIPVETVKAIEAAVSDTKKDADSLTVKLTEGSVTFDADAVKAIAAETKGDGLKVNLDDIGTEKLNTAQKSAVSDLTVETVLDAYVTSGSTRISDFKGGSATVSVKHTLKAAQSPAGIVVWYIADDGTRTQIPASFRNGEVVFTVTHFSNYVIAYDAEKAAAAGKLEAFIDLDSSAWYADGVLWALNNGVMNGVSPKYFNPNGDTTRAMVVTMLWRMEGSPAYAGASEFTDVDADTWYTEAVRWASTEGIVTGYDNPDDAGMIFNPNGAVTREQLATMLYRYAQYKKADVSASASLSSYGDAASVSSWAASATQWAVGSGIINGIDGNLVPAGNATRAQVATMLMRYSTAK